MNKRGQDESHFAEYAIVIILVLLLFFTILYVLQKKVLTLA